MLRREDILVGEVAADLSAELMQYEEEGFTLPFSAKDVPDLDRLYLINETTFACSSETGNLNSSTYPGGAAPFLDISPLRATIRVVLGVVIVEPYPLTRDSSQDLIGLYARNSGHLYTYSPGICRHSGPKG